MTPDGVWVEVFVTEASNDFSQGLRRLLVEEQSRTGLHHRRQRAASPIRDHRAPPRLRLDGRHAEAFLTSEDQRPPPPHLRAHPVVPPSPHSAALLTRPAL